jgi:hypothetical protein
MASKRCARRKPVPAVLRSPIVYSKATGEKGMSRQEEERLQAVYDFYGVDREATDSATRLVELMAKERFPTAFERRRKDDPKTKKPKWTSADSRRHLLEFFRDNQVPGMSQEDVARLYIKQFCPERGSPKGWLPNLTALRSGSARAASLPNKSLTM